MFLLTSSTILFYIDMFLMGMTVMMKSTIAYTYMMEFLPGKEAQYTGIMFFSEALIIILTPGFLYFMSRSVNYLLLFSFLINFVAFIVFLFPIMPESIRFSLEKGNIAKAKKDI